MTSHLDLSDNGCAQQRPSYQQLHEQLQQALQLLEEKDRDLIVAAEFGTQLLAQNADLVQASKGLGPSRVVMPEFSLNGIEASILSPSPMTPSGIQDTQCTADLSVSPSRGTKQDAVRWPTRGRQSPRTPRRSVSGVSENDMSEYVSAVERDCADLRNRVIELEAQLKARPRSHAETSETDELKRMLVTREEELEMLRKDKHKLASLLAAEKRARLSDDHDLKDSLLCANAELDVARKETAQELAARRMLEKRLQRLSDELAVVRQQAIDLNGAAEKNAVLTECCERQEVLIEELKSQLEETRDSFADASRELNVKITPLRPTLPETPTFSPSQREDASSKENNPFKDLAAAIESERSPNGPAQSVAPRGQIFDRVSGLGGGLASHSPSPPHQRGYLRVNQQPSNSSNSRRSLRKEIAQHQQSSDSDEDQMFLTPNKLSDVESSVTRSSSRNFDRTSPPPTKNPPLESEKSASPPQHRRTRTNSIDLFLPPSPALSTFSARSRKLHSFSHESRTGSPSLAARLEAMESSSDDDDDEPLNGGTAVMSMLWRLKDWLHTSNG
ncbi:hypothetical protein HKX48_004855 [Thoreauomyces humboldtii]|nr:hypothetical protein HKX48_004855 [Thoreauomyces humboldtii]